MTRLRWVRFESAALGGVGCEVKALDGEDELNRLFSFSVAIHVPGVFVTETIVHDLLQRPATLSFEDHGTVAARVHGRIAQVKHGHAADPDSAALSLTLVPRAWVLTQARRSKPYVNRAVPEIIAEKLTAAGLEEGTDFLFALRDRYPVRELVAQHAETDFDFIARLCEDLGIIFFFRHDDGRDVLVMTDTPDAFEPIPRPRPELTVGARSEHRAAFDVVRTVRPVPEQALVHDYNHRAPRLDLLASVQTAKDTTAGAWVEYGVHAKTPEEAARLARVRAEEIGATHDTTWGRSTDITLRPGATFVLVDTAGDEHPLLLTKVAHRAHLPEEADSRGARTWHNEFTAIPAHVPYRPARRTPRPRLPGLYHAIVDGVVRGPHAELDPAGRYWVRFRHDLSERGAPLASRPVRMLQPHAGAHYGMHFPLRPSTEVLISFVEGDPDRPVIAGAVPNAETPSPVTRTNQTQNVLRTVSGNELVIEDALGSERVRMHSPKHDTTLQLGARNEPEEGALLRTRSHLTLIAGRSLDTVTDRGTGLMATGATLVAGNAVSFVGVPGLAGDENRNASDFGRLRAERMPAVLEKLSDLVPVVGVPRADDGAEPDRGTPAAPIPATFSDVGEALSARAHQVAAGSVATIAESADAASAGSEPRTCGEPACPAEDPRLVLGSMSNATLFSRDTTLVHAERTASVSSTDTARVVAAKKVDLSSPEEVEISGRRSIRVTSSNLLDLRGRQIAMLAGSARADFDDALSPEVSASLVTEGALHLRSVEGELRACAAEDLLLHSHEKSVQLLAKQSIAATAGAFSCAAGTVTISAEQRLHIEAPGAEITLEGGVVTVKAATIRLVGNVSVTGALDVAGGIKGVVQGR